MPESKVARLYFCHIAMEMPELIGYLSRGLCRLKPRFLSVGKDFQVVPYLKRHPRGIPSKCSYALACSMIDMISEPII